MSAGVSTTWQQVVEALAARAGQDDAAAARLAEVCLAAAPLTPECSRATRPGGLPSGRPPAEVIPRAAAALLDAVRGREGKVARYREVVGLLTIRGAWRPSSDDRYGEIRDQRERHDRALVLALELGDATLTAMCRYYRGSSELRLTHWPQALTDLLEAADVAVALLEADEDGGRHPGPFAAVSNRPVPWAEPHRVLVRMIACRALKWSANAASLLGDMEQWAVSVRRAVELAEPLAEVRPSMLVEALASQANLARHVGDRDTFRQVERRLRNWAETGGPERVLRGWLTVASDNAAHLHDYGRAYEILRRRLDVSCTGLTAAPPHGSAPHAYLPAVAELEERGLRARRVGLGNAAYDAALVLWRARTTAEDPDVNRAAHALLDLAERAWRSDGHNGLIAVRLSRARLDVDASTAPDRASVTDAALDVSRIALRAATRAHAVELATEWCRPGDERVLARIEEQVEQATPVLRSRGLFARALWFSRLAEHLGTGAGTGIERDAGARTDGAEPDGAAAEAWRQAEEDAVAAAAGLEADGVYVNARIALRAWVIAARAGASTGGEATDAVRLQRLLHAVRCVAELLITASHTDDRRRLARQYGAVFTEAVELAVQLGDTAAADLVMEAVRRDRVGVLITDLALRSDVSEEVRGAAERMIAANNALPEPPQVATDDHESGQHQERTLRRIAGTIADNRRQSLAQADRILGVLSSMADGRALLRITAGEVLAARRPGTSASGVLQLCPAGTGMLTDGTPSRRLYRRLTLADGRGRVEEHLDAVTLPFDVTRLRPDDVGYWFRLARLSPYLLPEPLLHRLRQRERDDPLRLMIVPSGLFDLAFDALPVDGERQLVDVAAVSVHTSLATMAHLLGSASEETRADTVAVYDTVTLTHTRTELAALRSHLPPVHTPSSRDEIRRWLGADAPVPRLLAMAVHGMDDQDGWGQVKQLPDRSRLTAAEAMTYAYPQLCVLASCHSAIRLRDGLELAGFPLALFARGATTVISSLFAIDDEATSQIMELYWGHLAGGADPVGALRAARIQWLDDAPDRRPSPRLWAGLTALGGAHC